jgi:hypothetical protein
VVTFTLISKEINTDSVAFLVKLPVDEEH